MRASSPTRSQKSVRRLSDSSGISFDLTPSRSKRGAKVSVSKHWRRGGIPRGLRTDADLQYAESGHVDFHIEQRPHRVCKPGCKALFILGVRHNKERQEPLLY